MGLGDRFSRVFGKTGTGFSMKTKHTTAQALSEKARATGKRSVLVTGGAGYVRDN